MESSMRTFEQIKQRRLQKKRKWGADLIALCNDKLHSNLTIEEIVEWLNAEPINLGINTNDFTQLKFRYFNNKIKFDPVEKTEDPSRTSESEIQQQPKNIIAQKEVPIFSDEFYKRMESPKSKEDPFEQLRDL